MVTDRSYVMKLTVHFPHMYKMTLYKFHNFPTAKTTFTETVLFRSIRTSYSKMLHDEISLRFHYRGDSEADNIIMISS